MSLIGKLAEIENEICYSLPRFKAISNICLLDERERENVLAIMRISRIDFHTPKSRLSLRARPEREVMAMTQITRRPFKIGNGQNISETIERSNRCSS